MNNSNILQNIYCNARDDDQSPIRKKPRLERHPKPETSRWSLSQGAKQLDVLEEMGLGMLEPDDGPDCKPEDSVTATVDEDDNHVGDLDAKNYRNENDHTPREKKEQNKKKHKKEKRKELIRSSQNWEDFCLYKRCSIMSQEQSKDWFNELSDEIVLMIFRWVPKRFLPKCALVCKRWYRLTADETLWTRLNCSAKAIDTGSLGHIISRQVILLKLAQAEISDPAFLPNCKAYSTDFCSKLMYLDLSMALISVVSLTELLSKCSRLRKLSLEACQVSDEVCACLARNENLEVLNMAMVEGLTTKGFTSLVNHCEHMKELNIAWTSLSTETITYLCNKLPRNLVRLNISGCRKTLNNTHVRDLVQRCPNLVELDLSDCTALTNDVIKYIVTFNKLDCLALSRCYGVHCLALRKLNQLSTLMFLDIHGGHITQEEIDDLRKHLSNRIQINKFMFSSLARPTVPPKRSSIWNLSVYD